MRYRVGPPVRKIDRERPGATRSAVSKREDGMSVAVSFDRGTVGDGVSNAHAVDVVTGLLDVRGWRAE